MMHRDSTGEANASAASGEERNVAEGQDAAEHILVVEDDPHILRQIEFALRTNGFAVQTATNGTEALKHMLIHPPRLLITDIMMPEMDGYELVSMVRRDEILADIPVIMLTARAEDVSVAQGYTSGTDLYLTKPFNPTELLQFVRRILG